MQARAYTSSPNKAMFDLGCVEWTVIKYNAFIAMYKIVGYDVLLSYPNFSERFIIHTDAGK